MKRILSLIFQFFIGFLSVMIVAYFLAIFAEIPGLSTARNIWIETAMTTGDHQWLATYFFPESIIDKVMAGKIEDQGEVGRTEIIIDKPTKIEIPETKPIQNIKPDIKEENNIEFEEIELEPLKIIPEKEDIINEADNDSINTLFTDDDEFGNRVIINDKEQGIKIVEIKNASYTGKLVFIDDPSRVFIANTDKKGSIGKLILDYLEDNNAIIGINANGFIDYEGKGLGGEIIGYSISNGESWGSGAFNAYTTIGFDNENRLVVGKINDHKEYNIRDGAQFKPALILNGEILIKGTAGWGLQPRTIVAQRADGVVMFLVVDGRQPGYSLGITMGEAAELLYAYGAVNAAACDGGSSSVLAYNGEIINEPSTPMVTGRYLPNAFLVKKK